MAYATDEMRWLADQWETAIGSAVCSGIVGDSQHVYGYHRAANEVPASDYSRQLPGDRNGVDMAAADALDMSHNPAEMKLVTGRFYASWKDQHDLRLNYVREVIGTLDGAHVIYMDTQSGQQGTADSSHLWHVHVGGLRCNAHNRTAMNAVLSIVKGQSWADYCAAHPEDPLTHMKPAPGPATPPFPLTYPPNVYGDINGPSWSHGGFYASERPTVARIQSRLNAAGFPCGTADGVFGPRTIAATRAFQRAHGLEVDGKVGPATWRALFT